VQASLPEAAAWCEAGPERQGLEAIVSPNAKPDSNPTDETRRKFREALERKRSQQHASDQAAGADGTNKSHGSRGPIKNREFRRKSG
jgi:Family of unknown function (DUF5302)